MKGKPLIGVLLPVCLLAAGIVFSCIGVEFPVNLVIDGMKSDNISGDIASIEEKENTLVLSVKTAGANHTLTVRPWVKAGLFKDSSYTIQARQDYVPGGPIRMIKLFENSQLKAIIGDGIHMFPAPFQYTRASPGKEIKEKEGGNRIWVDVVLKHAGEEKYMSPGKHYNLKMGGEEWILIITGASIPAREEEVLSGDKETSPLIGEQGKTSDEEPAFIMDYILYRK